MHSVSDQGRVWSHRSKRLLDRKPNKDGYIQIHCRQGVVYRVHREVAMAFVPREADRDDVDHVNRVRIDNQASNLRWSTRAQNQHNRTGNPYGTSRFKGVDLNRGKFRAKIQVNGVDKFLGRFATELEAAVAYAREAVKIQGVFCPDEVRCLVVATPAILIA